MSDAEVVLAHLYDTGLLEASLLEADGFVINGNGTFEKAIHKTKGILKIYVRKNGLWEVVQSGWVSARGPLKNVGDYRRLKEILFNELTNVD